MVRTVRVRYVPYAYGMKYAYGTQHSYTECMIMKSVVASQIGVAK